MTPERAVGAMSVDPISCDGHGLCAELFPERIRLDDWGFPIIDAAPVPRELGSHARRAIASCPKAALRLSRASGADSSPRPSDAVRNRRVVIHP